ncbi:MAG: ComEC/Rec2 family competence protein, partial [Clostridia bacterium]|nr:ComEC/Rec2 family competence protein [Clostridia bacterium]
LLGFLPPWRRYLTATLAAQVAVLWHTALYFNIVSLGALLANLLVLPVIGAVTVLGLLLLFASLLLPALASSLALACGGLLYGLSESLAVLAGTPGVVLAVASPPWWSGLGYLGLLAALPELRLRRAALRPLFAAKRPALIFVLGLLPCLVLTAWRLAPGRPGILEVVFLDVGQGDATYVRTPAGTNLLIDAGGTPAGRKHTFDVGEKVVLPYLVRRGVKRLDLVVSTHPDADHLQGLFGVLRHLPASLVVLPPPSLFGQGYTEFLTFL